ncbi:MAG TPA: RHS repeat-associated core domain-containing protein [Baekduia sp.]|nr:RHS repeat-associated core domain-containing protein [Baekduia sp.]
MTYQRDAHDLLTQVKQGGTQVDIVRDALGRRTSTSLPNGVVETDEYDPTGQLSSQAVSVLGSTAGTLSYAYDALGRRTASWGSLDGTRLPDVLPTGTYDDADRLVSRGGEDHEYDASGNLLDDGTRTLTWNARGELTQAARGTLLESYTYDPQGRRVAVTRGDTSTSTIWDGWSEAATAAGGSTTSHLQLDGLDRVLVDVGDGGATTSLGDVLGTPIGSVAATGGLQPAAPHGPSGERVSGAAAARGWQGRTEDASGLSYFRARYYDPASSRFTSEDPRRLAGGGPNFYVFGGGDPINRMDPTGQFWMPHIPFPIPGLPPCTSSDAYGGGFCKLTDGPLGWAAGKGWDALRDLNPQVNVNATGCYYLCVQLGVNAGFDGVSVSGGTGIGLEASAGIGVQTGPIQEGFTPYVQAEGCAAVCGSVTGTNVGIGTAVGAGASLTTGGTLGIKW